MSRTLGQYAMVTILSWAAAVGVLLAFPLRGALADEPFRSGDLVVRTKVDLQVYRGTQKVLAFGESGAIAADRTGGVWVGLNRDGKLVLRRYSSTEVYREYSAAMPGTVASVRKVLASDGALFVVFTVDRGQAGQPIEVIRFSTADNTFSHPFALRDAKGNAEVLTEEGLWDAALLPSGQLWLSGYPSGSGGMAGYAVGNLPAGLEKEFGVETMGGNVHVLQVNPGLPTKSGNNRGIAVWSDTQLLVLDGASGRLSIFDPVNPDDATRSYPLTKAVDATIPGTWGGFISVLNGKQRMLVNSGISCKIYQIDPTTNQVTGELASGVVALELVEVP
jgi:hypothetical protein